MRIFDESKQNEIKDYDRAAGRLVRDTLFIAHHEAREACEEVGHYAVIREYPNGGRDVKWVVDKPAVAACEEHDEYEDILVFIPYTEKELARFVKIKESAYFNFCLELGDRFRLADGAVEMLDGIKEMGIPYCLATGSEKLSVDFFMEHLGLGRWFEYGKNIVYEDGSFTGKPAPDIYVIAAKKLGLSPSECLVFEDGTSGIMAANAAKVGAVIAVYQKGYPSPLTDDARADAVYHDHLLWKKTLADYGLMR